MTKKHFIALADTIKAFNVTNAGTEMDETTRGILIQHLANFCAAQNPNFNRDRWFGYITGTNGKNGERKVKHIHRPHNFDTMQTVCEDCGEEMDLRG